MMCQWQDSNVCLESDDHSKPVKSTTCERSVPLPLTAQQPSVIPVGGDLSINYVASATRTVASSAGLISVNAVCTSNDAAGLTLNRVTVQVNGQIPVGGDRAVGENVVAQNTQSFTELPIADAPASAQVVVTCFFEGVAAVTSSPVPATFSERAAGAVGETATLTAVTTLPVWSQYFQSPQLNQAPQVSFPQNNPPNGLPLTGDQTVAWTLRLQDAYVCLTGAQVVTTATLASAAPTINNPAPATVTLSTADSCVVPAATIGPVTSEARLNSVYTWTVDKTVSSGSVSVARGSDIVLDYTLAVTRTLSSSSGTITRLTVPITNPSNGLTTKVDRCELVYAGSTVATQTGSSVNAGASTTIQFTNVPLTSSSGTTGAPVTPPLSEDVTVRCFFDGSSTSVDALASITYTNTAGAIGATAVIDDTFTYPTWSNWVTGGQLATPVPVITGNNPDGAIVTDSATFSYTLTLSRVVLCFQSATVRDGKRQ
eukprot:gene10002-10156_t